MITLPPPPKDDDRDIKFDWFLRVRNAINNLASGLSWGNIDKTGASITDIADRKHNDLQSIQGGSTGSYYHLTSAQINEFNAKADKTLVFNNQTGSTYTLALTDAIKYIRMNNASAQTLVVPPNADVAIPVGSTCHVRQVGAGQVTIVADTGVTILTPETLLLRKEGAIISLTKVDTNTWEIYGDLESA